MIKTLLKVLFANKYGYTARKDNSKVDFSEFDLFEFVLLLISNVCRAICRIHRISMRTIDHRSIILFFVFISCSECTVGDL